MTAEYKIYDRRNGDLVDTSYQPDVSTKSENAAIKASGLSPVFAECETRELSDDAAREHFPRK